MVNSKDAYYFPHDSNAQHDEKCAYLIAKLGYEGYGIYWGIIERMHESKYGKLSLSLIDGLAFQLNIDITKVKQIFNVCIECKLFVKDDEHYWSERVLRNKMEFEHKRELKSIAGKKGMAIRYQGYNSVITQPNKVKESKVKESKVKESKGNGATRPALEYFSSAYMEKFKQPYVAAFGKDGAIMKDLLKLFNLEQLKQKIDMFFNTDDKFVEKAGYSVGIFKTKINSLNIKPKESDWKVGHFV